MKRRPKPDSDNEMLRELVRVLCESLFRSRSISKSEEPRKKSKWFNVVTERVSEVESAMEEWSPYMTTILNVLSGQELVESWSIRYATNYSDGSKGSYSKPMYSKLMVLARSLITVAQALPASRGRSKNTVQMRFYETNGDAYDNPPPLSEQFCFPSVDMVFGHVDVQVRYRNDVIYNNPSGGTSVSPPTANILAPSIVEDYVGRTIDDADDDDDAENRRWRRWASESFDERERELLEQQQQQEEEEEEISSPPENTRTSSNPMAIPVKKDENGHSSKRSHDHSLQSASIGRGVRRESSGSLKKSSLKVRHSRTPSAEDGNRVPRFSTSNGYSVSDLINSGTPIFSSLPFAVGSMASSAASNTDSRMDPASMRSKFLAGLDFNSVSPTFPFMSTGSLMVSRHSSAFAILDAPAPSPSPQLNSFHQALPQKSTAHYDAALPWILTPSEMERPFSGMGNSITLGMTLEDQPRMIGLLQTRRKKRNNHHDDILDDDNDFGLPFVADEDVANEQGELDEGDEMLSTNSELGAFARRCREAPGIFVGQESVKVEDVQKQLELLVQLTGLDKVQAEVVTVHEEPTI